MPTPEEERRSLLLLVVLGLIWGSAYPVIRFGILAGATPIAFAAVRYAISAAGITMMAAATAGVRAPNLRPSDRKFGFTS